jgi:REP element-mobilizing transposase RayT
MHVNQAGAIVERAWTTIVDCAASLTTDAWVVMPNHFHGLLVPIQRSRIPSEIAVVAWRAARGASARVVGSDLRARGPAPRSLAAIVGAFKSATSREINYHRGTPGALVWQRGYYERIIGDEVTLTRVRQYILNNPLNWRA